MNPPIYRDNLLTSAALDCLMLIGPRSEPRMAAVSNERVAFVNMGAALGHQVAQGIHIPHFQLAQKAIVDVAVEVERGIQSHSVINLNPLFIILIPSFWNWRILQGSPSGLTVKYDQWSIKKEGKCQPITEGSADEIVGLLALILALLDPAGVEGIPHDAVVQSVTGSHPIETLCKKKKYFF